MGVGQAGWPAGPYAHATPLRPLLGPASAPGPQFILMKMVHAQVSESSCLSGRMASVLRRRSLQKKPRFLQCSRSTVSVGSLGDAYHLPGAMGRCRGLASGPRMLRGWW